MTTPPPPPTTITTTSLPGQDACLPMSFDFQNIITWVKQGYMEPVVSNENTISFTSAPPVAAAAAAAPTFDFFDGEDAFLWSSISSLVAAVAYKNINLKTNSSVSPVRKMVMVEHNSHIILRRPQM